MPLDRLNDVAYASGNPNGIGPFQAVSTIEPFFREFLDVNWLTTPAVKGKLVRLQASATNTGGANYLASTVANEPLASRQYGIVSDPATTPTTVNGDLNQQKGVMVTSGTAFALCTTTGTGISLDSALVSDGAGNLTLATGTPAAGIVLARSLGTLASGTSTPTLVLVHVGGY